MDDFKDNIENLKEEELLALARRQYSEALEYYNEMWEKGKDDIEFINGTNHWNADILKERTADQRPSLVINHAPKFVRQVIGDQRQNSPQAKIRPVDSQADPAMATMLEGLNRNIEYVSNAKAVYDTAFRHSVGNGFGYIRIITEFSGDDTFEQNIRYKRVFNPFSVLLDPNAQEFDHSDGRFAFVTDWVTRADFKDRYPDAEMVSFEDAKRVKVGDWHKNDEVLVAEYFRRVPIKKTLALLADGRTIDITGRTEDEVNKSLAEDEEPTTILRTKKVDSFKTLRYLINGSEILEKATEFPSKYIPLVPVWGEEVITREGRREFNSVIRFMKDPNRMYNFMRSAEVEHIALAPKAPYVGTATQFQGQEDQWDNANRKNYGRLTYNPDPEAPGAPQRQAPPMASTGINNASMMAMEDMKNTTGQFDASVGAQGNETSGKAIMARQREGDVSTFVWIDNLTTAQTHATRIVLDLIPKIYDTDRIIRVRGFDDKDNFVPINQELEDDKGKSFFVNDISVGKYDVVVETGPSYSTQRVESAESMVAFARAMGPEASSIIADLVAKNQDWPGATEIAKRLRKILPPGIAEPEEGDLPPETPEPTPAEQLESKKLEQEDRKIDLEDKKLEVEFEKIKLEIAKLQLEQKKSPEEIRDIVLEVLTEAQNRGGL